MMRFLFFVLTSIAFSASAQRNLEIELSNDVYQESYSISTLRFYLSNLRFHVSGGSWVEQKQRAYLIDIEDKHSWKIELPMELGKSQIDSVSFLIGIDSATNVAGILEGDLDPIKGMYWAWNSGYINFKIEGKQNTSHQKFEYHLGGYLPPFASSREVLFSRNPTNKRLKLQFDLKQFLDQIDMNQLKEVMIPGPEAIVLSDVLMNCFILE